METPDETPSEELWENREDKSERNEQNDGGEYHPWRRFFARTIDLFFISIIFIVTFLTIGSLLFPRTVSVLIEALGNPLISGVVVYVLWVPVEAFFIYRRGATPGKWLFGISVLDASGQTLTYPDALQRTFLVWIKGDGLGIPIVALITRIFAYKRLMRTGTTLWDTAMGSVVTHSEFSMLRKIACTAAVALAIGASAILSVLGNA
ncbi:MAG: RDD family protein [Thermodesulfobacteriota bacterium]